MADDANRILTEDEVFTILADLCGRRVGPDDEPDGRERNDKIRLLGWSHNALSARAKTEREALLGAMRQAHAELESIDDCRVNGARNVLWNALCDAEKKALP
jgi:hypothetical protein